MSETADTCDMGDASQRTTTSEKTRASIVHHACTGARPQPEPAAARGGKSSAGPSFQRRQLRFDEEEWPMPVLADTRQRCSHLHAGLSRPTDMHLVLHNAEKRSRLFVGNFRSAQREDVLQDHGITHIVNCAPRTLKNYFERPSSQGGTLRVSYFRFDAIDACRTESQMPQDLRPHPAHNKATHTGKFREVFEYIDQAMNVEDGGVLIHCFAGAHRAGTLAVAYVLHTFYSGRRDWMLPGCASDSRTAKDDDEAWNSAAKQVGQAVAKPARTAEEERTRNGGVWQVEVCSDDGKTLPVEAAIAYCQQCRPAIDPGISGALVHVLRRLEAGYRGEECERAHDDAEREDDLDFDDLGARVLESC